MGHRGALASTLQISQLLTERGLLDLQRRDQNSIRVDNIPKWNIMQD